MSHFETGKLICTPKFYAALTVRSRENVATVLTDRCSYSGTGKNLSVLYNVQTCSVARPAFSSLRQGFFVGAVQRPRVEFDRCPPANAEVAIFCFTENFAFTAVRIVRGIQKHSSFLLCPRSNAVFSSIFPSLTLPRAEHWLLPSGNELVNK